MKTRLVKFKFKPPHQCNNIKIAGDFTEWEKGAIIMSKSGRTGEWTASVRVPAGEHQYRFMIDGNWFTDPSTEHSINPFGSSNSILRVN